MINNDKNIEVMNSKGIVIYTTPEKLLHKQGKLENDSDHSKYGIYFWSLRNTPKDYEIIDKIYFATKGFIRGYFEIEDIDNGLECQIEFHCSTWKEIEPIPCKHFQGFKYFTVKGEDMNFNVSNARKFLEEK